MFSVIVGSTEHATEVSEEDESHRYEQKAHEIVQSILQEVVNTVAGGLFFFLESVKESCYHLLMSFKPACFIYVLEHKGRLGIT